MLAIRVKEWYNSVWEMVAAYQSMQETTKWPTVYCNIAMHISYFKRFKKYGLFVAH